MDTITGRPDTQAPAASASAAGWTKEYPLPPTLGSCVLIRDFLSPAECSALIAQAETRGFASAELDYPPSYRNNDRQVLDDPALAHRLLRRLHDLFGDDMRNLLPVDLRDTWRLQGINERLRLCKYRSGQQFRIHQDGVHHRGQDCRSMLTFMVYLAEGDAFDGGDTVFYAAGPAQGEGEEQVVARVRPAAGSLILFDHGIWHAGATVTRGTKYILRSDLLFHREGYSRTPASPTHHQGYIWTLAALSDGRLASGGRDASIRLWHPDGAPAGVLTGHTQSVLGLVEAAPGVLASVSRDRTLRFWDTSSGRCLRSAAAHGSAVLSLTRLPDGLLATGGADHAIHLWSEHGEHVGSLPGHEGWVWGLAALGDDVLASASEDQTVRLWRTSDAQCFASLALAHPLRTIDAEYTQGIHGTQRMAVGDASGAVTLWSIDQGAATEIASFMAHDAAVRRVRFLRDGSLATCGEDHRLRIWHLDSLERIHESIRGNFVTDVIEQDDETQVSSGYDGALVWSRARR